MFTENSSQFLVISLLCVMSNNSKLPPAHFEVFAKTLQFGAFVISSCPITELTGFSLELSDAAVGIAVYLHICTREECKLTG